MIDTLCVKCGKTIEGYIAKVNTVETRQKNGSPEEWCEDCCIAHGTCKCDGCSEEFTEEFWMPRINGGLFCVRCARDQSPPHFDRTPISNDESAFYFFQAKIYETDTNILAYVSETYSTQEAVYDELRDSLDKIGQAIGKTSEIAAYLGDEEYEEGRQYDENESYDFNRETLSNWIECLIELGSYTTAFLHAFIIKNEILDRYEPVKDLPV